jgi:hypothetical protein
MSGPSTKTIKRLFAVSGNRCAFPGCTLPLVDTISGTVLGEICHIQAQSAGGPRYDPNQSDEARHGFDNLLLLCPAHHKTVDENPDTHTVEALQEMKRAHEARHAGGAEPSDEITERFLIQIEGNVGGSVIGGNLTLSGGSTFVGGKMVTASDKDE